MYVVLVSLNQKLFNLGAMIQVGIINVFYYWIRGRQALVFIQIRSLIHIQKARRRYNHLQFLC